MVDLHAIMRHGGVVAPEVHEVAGRGAAVVRIDDEGRGGAIRVGYVDQAAD